jgi:hypothetical protein
LARIGGLGASYFTLKEKSLATSGSGGIVHHSVRRATRFREKA